MPAFPVLFVLIFFQAVLNKAKMLLFEVFQLGRVISGRVCACWQPAGLCGAVAGRAAWPVSALLPRGRGMRGKENLRQNPPDR